MKSNKEGIGEWWERQRAFPGSDLCFSTSTSANPPYCCGRDLDNHNQYFNNVIHRPGHGTSHLQRQQRGGSHAGVGVRHLSPHVLEVGFLLSIWGWEPHPFGWGPLALFASRLEAGLHLLAWVVGVRVNLPWALREGSGRKEAGGWLEGK